MAQKGRHGLDSGEVKSIPITLGFSPDANSAVVDVKNGRIVRIRPLHFDWKYDKKEFNAWKMEVRGKTFEPGMKTLLPPFSLAYKKRVYSPNRILYPLKRVDWDPDGQRNPQNRGRSKYRRISWDEATDIIVREIKRVQAKYGPYGILVQSDGHGEVKYVHSCHGGPAKFLGLMGDILYRPGIRIAGRGGTGGQACLGHGARRPDDAGK